MIRVLTSLILCSTWCRAAVVPQLALDQLVDGSECIIQGTVLRSWSAWDQPHHFIWTHIEVLVRDRWKESASSANPTVVLSEPGGTVTDRTMQVAGTAAYRVGEDVVVFLYRTPVGYLRAIGNGQGKFTITQGAGSPEKHIRSDLAGIEFIRGGPESSGRTGLRTESSKMNGMGLDEFRRTVQSLIARKAAQ
ncbi:MAG: hypothetical protein JWO48_3522 [Bryobacterales bacterium]|nr:hypothetical protein [Bryobacterales bacterium]